jgi:uncharacterized protein (TIGR02996 family)
MLALLDGFDVSCTEPGRVVEMEPSPDLVRSPPSDMAPQQMTDHDALLATVLENPADNTARLVLADLLRESEDGAQQAPGRFLWAGVTASAYHDDEEERAEKRRVSSELGLKPGLRWTLDRDGWTPKQLALMSTDTDAIIAGKLSRTENAVRLKREQLAIQKYVPPNHG